LLDWYNEHAGNKFVFHNYNRAIELATLALEIAQGEKVAKDDVESIVLAALFLETDILTKDQTSLAHWKNFAGQDGPEKKLLLTEKLLREINDIENNATYINILRDAKTAATFRKEYQEKLPILRLEEELVETVRVPTSTWNTRLYQIVLEANYLTATGKNKFLQEKNILLGSLAGKIVEYKPTSEQIIEITLI